MLGTDICATCGHGRNKHLNKTSLPESDRCWALNCECNNFKSKSEEIKKAVEAHAINIRKDLLERGIEDHVDPIEKEIYEFKKKYGHKWRKHYNRAIVRLAKKESKKEMKRINAR